MSASDFRKSCVIFYVVALYFRAYFVLKLASIHASKHSMYKWSTHLRSGLATVVSSMASWHRVGEQFADVKLLPHGGAGVIVWSGISYGQ